jgi:hypothetical protein
MRPASARSAVPSGDGGLAFAVQHLGLRRPELALYRDILVVQTAPAAT